MCGLLTGKIVEDVTGRVETFPVINRVDNHTGLGVVRRQNILDLKIENIYISDQFSGVELCPTDISLLG